MVLDWSNNGPISHHHVSKIQQNNERRKLKINPKSIKGYYNYNSKFHPYATSFGLITAEDQPVKAAPLHVVHAQPRMHGSTKCILSFILS